MTGKSKYACAQCLKIITATLFSCFYISEYDILVANGFYIHQLHFEGNNSDTIYTNTSGRVVGIDFHFQ